MEYILTEQEDRRVIPICNIIEIHENKELSTFAFLTIGDGAKWQMVEEDNFEVREMSALELTTWLKGEQEESEDDE